jgi:predicted dithiol-disulfide oxidoreductase (DUF899 family)
VAKHRIVSQEEWAKARKALLAEEQAMIEARERLAQARQQLPWVKIEKEYVFDTVEGRRSLTDLFEGRSQLLVQHFMFAPDWDAGCPGCSFAADHIAAAYQHLRHHDVTFIAVSRAPVAKLEAYRKRMGWRFNWVSSQHSDFSYDFHVSFRKEERATGKVYYNFEMTETDMEDLPGGSAFYQDADGTLYHTYSAYGRGGDEILAAYRLLDIMPKGRNESAPMEWVRRHDEYEDAARKRARA